MGLDIYAGCLVRYYSGDWETIVQRYARENNLGFYIIRTNEQNDEERPNREQILEAIELWKSRISYFLESHYSIKDNWDENFNTEYQTDKPDWDNFGAVILGNADYWTC